MSVSIVIIIVINSFKSTYAQKFIHTNYYKEWLVTKVTIKSLFIQKIIIISGNLSNCVLILQSR